MIFDVRKTGLLRIADAAHDVAIEHGQAHVYVSGYVVTISKDRGGYTRADIRVSGVERLGPLGDWLSDTVQHVVTTGCGVLEYDLEIHDGEVRAVQVATGRAA